MWVGAGGRESPRAINVLVLLDTAGPMARNVTDVAKLLDVLVGYDPHPECNS